MIQADDWFEAAQARGFDFLTGVPCSYLKPFINRAISGKTTKYVGAASEGEAVGIAAGAWLGGRGTVVLCQGSGLGNMVNPLSSLNWAFRIPTLLITTWRGQPGVKDEPQHRLMGEAMAPLLDALRVPHELFPTEAHEIVPSMDRAAQSIAETGLPYAFVMQKGSVAPHALTAPAVDRGQFPPDRVDLRPSRRRPELSRREAVRVTTEVLGPDAAYLATTGKLGRELFAQGDRANQFYHVGAMGCVSGVGLGVALTRPDRKVVVLDGDGSVLMKMGALATIGHQAPRNFVHVVLDNERHESTGGQSTSSSTVEFAQVAAGAGYRRAYAAGSEADLRQILETVRKQEGPVLVHQKVTVDTDPDLVRPDVTPDVVARRFRDWLAGGSA